ncbi:unnamed protein product [Colias eurytheme]|nr:unnamed protein product [Colias eurytheme]
MPNPKIVLYQPLIEPQQTSWSKPVENIEIRPSSASAVYPHKVFIQPSQLPHTNPFEISPTYDVEPNQNSQSVLYQPDIYVQSPWHKSFGKIPIMNMKINPNTETTYKPQPQDFWSKPITEIPSLNVEVNPNAEGTIYRPEMVVKPSQMPTKTFDNELSPNINVEVSKNPQATMYTPNVQLSQAPRLQSIGNIPILDTEINPNHESSQYPPKQLILPSQPPSSNLVDNRYTSNVQVLPSTGSSYRPQISLQPSQGPSYKPYNNIPIVYVSPTSESSENIPLSDPKPNSKYTWSQPISQSLQTPWNKPSNIPVLNVEVNPNQDSKMYRPAVLLQPTHKSYSIPVENVPIIEVNPNQETTLNQPKQFIMPSGTPWWQPFERIPVSGVEMKPNSQSTLYKPEIITQQFPRPIENVIIPNIDTRLGSETNPYQSAFVSPSQTPHSQSLDKPTLDIEMGPSKSTLYRPEMFIQPSFTSPQSSLLSPLITVSPVPTIKTPSSTFYTPDSKYTIPELPVSIWTSPNQPQIPQKELNIILPNDNVPEYKGRPTYFNLKPYTNEVKDHPNPSFNNMNIASDIKNYSPEYKIISRPFQSVNI